MKKPELRAELKKIRDALAHMDPGAASHQAGVEPDPAIIFAPPSHANALDPDRVLVIGNRGVGKSFWSAVLVHAKTRVRVAKDYPKLRLDKMEAVLGFHEDAGKDDGPAPSQAMLIRLLKVAERPEDIWRAVLLKSLSNKLSFKLPTSLQEIIVWSSENVEDSERLLREADQNLLKSGRTFLIIFDALDRLGRDWSTISLLSEGLLRFALDVRGFKAIRTKIFMRTDQANDDSLFRFADASKIKADSVKLVWQRSELFGLLYYQLMADNPASSALLKIGPSFGHRDLLKQLRDEEEIQEYIFYIIAGEFMGAGAKRGRTYSWLFDHLADAFGETSPRSFITALQRAANHMPAPAETAIDHNGIRAGVQVASEIRVAQLKEDYDWITSVLQALEDLEVPCDPAVFKSRWVERKTVSQVATHSAASNNLLPLELERSKGDPEGSLLLALSNIGVVEFRTENRINMPDIFRVAAGIKRRGGVRPPQMKRRR
jgi:hypothetical protein